MSGTGVERVLWVEASPKGPESLSSACAGAFLDAAGAHRSLEVVRCDVWSADLPEFGREAALAKFAPIFGLERTPAQQAVWDRVDRFVADVEAFDGLVISSPMWNWSVPYRLKHWLDLVCQPMRTFTVDGEGRHVGVIGVGRWAQLLLTRSSAYDGRSPEMEDHQRPYLEYVLGGMLGYALGETVVVEPTTRRRPEARAAVRAEAIERSRAAGAAFAASLASPRGVPVHAAVRPRPDPARPSGRVRPGAAEAGGPGGAKLR